MTNREHSAKMQPMPADTLTISLTGALADEVRAAAKARGITPEEYVRQQLAWDIALGDDDAESSFGVAEDRAAYEDFERTGIGIPGEEVDAWLQSLATDNPLPRPRPRKLK
jgi:hypothetical protein